MKKNKKTLELFLIVFQNSDYLINVLGINEEEFENMLGQWAKEIESYHSYFVTLRFYCQKHK